MTYNRYTGFLKQLFDIFRQRQDHLRPLLDKMILDNLTPHKSIATLARIATAGASVRFCPPTRPDLNSIEKKGLLHAAHIAAPVPFHRPVAQREG